LFSFARSAVLNPDRGSLCLDSQRATIDLPIRVNQTDPILIEVLRMDLNTGENETITIPAKQLKTLKRQAEKKHTAGQLHRDLLFPVRKTGIYRLQRVIDESQLDVHTRTFDALVVSCPRALIKNSHIDKCKGELSNFKLEVEGTPPLKIKYSRQVNNLDRGFSVLNIQPDNLRSPLLNGRTTSALFSVNQPDVSWAQSQKIEVPLNESLNDGGEWFYTIEEVHDAIGNVANYSTIFDEGDRPSTKSQSQWYQFSVHERPQLSLQHCNLQNPLQVAKGDSTRFPFSFHPDGNAYSGDGPFSVGYSFTGNTQQDEPADEKTVSMKNMDHAVDIKEPGLYTLTSVSTKFCQGEILEPSSCYLHNPPEPELAVRAEKVFDKCANNAIGLIVDLDLTGSPPFSLRYSVESSKGVVNKVLTIDGMRTQLDLTPSEAGFYRYTFLDLEDFVYSPRNLKDKLPVLEQDVKPAASAQFLSRQSRYACFGESVPVEVSFLGEAPWSLQYEIVHNGKRTKKTLESDIDIATITTDKLVSGGSYTVALTNVKDKSQCKRALKESINIEARSQPPHVSFGQIDKKRSVLALQGSKIEIPVRLSGERPWTVKYRNADVDSQPIQKNFWDANSVLTVDKQGLYEISEVFDAACPGTVDQSANEFEVSWIPRPQITALDGSPIGAARQVAKSEICQGDDDSLEVRLSGSPPYNLQYEKRRKADRGGLSSAKPRALKSALHVTSMEMDTSEPGEYIYKFTQVADNLYDHDPQNDPLVVTQKVNPLPSAKFDAPGHVYGFCKEDISGEEVIPITLEGVPPFSLEINIKHNSNAKPEIVTIPKINSNRHNLLIPRRHLDLGQHVVSIHKVRDSRGCQKTTEFDASSVRVAISDVPTIIPLESKTDYCVGERLSFSLSGHAPFEVFYMFNNAQRKAKSQNTVFRRIAEHPGDFTITAVSDGASGKCKAHKDITKVIHAMPSVRISKGKETVVDIHEGGEAELHFEFWGTPPFEFT
jgi:nucleoporin POM152